MPEHSEVAIPQLAGETNIRLPLTYLYNRHTSSARRRTMLGLSACFAAASGSDQTERETNASKRAEAMPECAPPPNQINRRMRI